MDNKNEIALLAIKIENLLLRQQNFEAEIEVLKRELERLKNPGAARNEAPLPPVNVTFSDSIQPPVTTETAKPMPPRPLTPPPSLYPPKPNTRFTKENLLKSDFEKFLGENLISKIGILVLIIGVIIGAKYAIEHELISPLTRIVLGYAIGIALTLFAIKLKAKYENFSAVLLSGALAILYFITFAAYSFYGLLPQLVAFPLMLAFTAFGVLAAIKYDKQVIAHIGLVGAYGIPFLLSSGSGNVVILFSYISIINIGILIISLQKHWKKLLYLSFIATWSIYLSWLLFSKAYDEYFNAALIFASIFFIIFYVANLAYKIKQKETLFISDIILVLFNSFIYYGAGFYILQEQPQGAKLLGLFTVANAIIHFIATLVIKRSKIADKNLFYFVLALVITFVTIAVPVQLNGGWVTTFWAVEAAVLLYISRQKQVQIYEKISLPLIVLSFISLLHDWGNYANIFYGYSSIDVYPFLNLRFLTGAIFIAAFGFMFWLTKKEPQKTSFISQFINYSVPSLLIFVTYFTFYLEISAIFDRHAENTKINTTPNAKTPSYVYNYSLGYIKNVWLHIYTLIYATILVVINLYKAKNNTLAVANIIINCLALLIFLTGGLLMLSEIRDAYLYQSENYFRIGAGSLLLRYIAYAVLGIFLYYNFLLCKSSLSGKKLSTAFYYVLYITILWLLSSELLHILALSGLKSGYKLGLSILWGSYSLILIAIGIWKNKKYIRIGAIGLFGITLLKLFLYDITQLNTIAKTIAFVALGVLLLIISFLYNKYKHLIIDDVKTEN